MKKIIALIICISLLTVNSSISFAEEKEDVLGLEKFFDEICLNNDYNASVREKILESHAVILDGIVTNVMSFPDYAKSKMGIKTGDDEYEEAQIRQMHSLDLDKGVLINSINTTKYTAQYAQFGCLSYLFNENKLFKVPQIFYGELKFSTDGIYLTQEEADEIYGWDSPIIDDGTLDYLKNHKNLENELLKKGETEIQKVSLFNMVYWTFLYIKGEVNEYLIEVYSPQWGKIPQIKPYTLYTAAEILNAVDDPEFREAFYSNLLAELVLTTKPTYDTEAQALHADGLLQGNENGLDLLKPLTRIEATAILVRAMDLEDTPTSETSYFSDIQSDNWGAKYANIAKDKGIATGVGDSLFAPNDTITASQFATLILRNQGENPDWQTAIDLFVERGLITAEQSEKMDLFTRGDMAKIIYEARLKDLF